MREGIPIGTENLFFRGANVWHHPLVLWSVNHSVAFSLVIWTSELSLWYSEVTEKGDI